MDQTTLAKTLMRLARRDVSTSNVGRLLLTDLKADLDYSITFKDVQQALTEYYLGVDVEQATSNVILVYFDGKEAVLNLRKLQEPIIPEMDKEF